MGQKYIHDKKTTSITISKKLTLINVLSSIITQIFSLGVLVWLQRYLLQRISPEEYSLLPLVMSVFAFLPLLSTIFNSGVGRFMMEAYAKGDPEGVIKVISSIYPFLYCLALILSIISIYISLNIDTFLNIPLHYRNDAILMFILTIFAFISNFISLPYSVCFAIKQKFVIQDLINTGTEILRLFLLLVFLFMLGAHVKWVVLAFFIATLTRNLINFFFSKKYLPFLKIDRDYFDVNVAKKVLGFGSWTLLGQTASRIRQSSDPILLNIWSTPMHITSFYLGSILNRQIDNLTPIILRSLQPVLIKLYVDKNKDAIGRLFLTVTKYLFWFFLIIMVPAFIFNKEIIELYVGSKFLLAASVMSILLISRTIELTVELIPRICSAVNKVKELTIINFIIQFTNLSLTFILLKYYNMGALGSALGSFIAVIVGVTFLLLPFSLRVTHIKLQDWFRKTCVPGVLPGLVVAVFLVLLRIRLHPCDLDGLLFSFLACLPLYLISIFFCMSYEDKQTIGQIVKFFQKRLKSIG